MDPLSQIKVKSLMDLSRGTPQISIGLIDGPVNLSHFGFASTKITAVRKWQLIACKNATSTACEHGTFIAGILSAKRGLSAPAICPDCTLLLRPIFGEETANDINTKGISVLPRSTPEELSDAIKEVVDAGARIINLSLGLSASSLNTYPILEEAYEYARQHAVIIVAASGNQGSIGSASIIQNEWIMPVAACDENGLLDPVSNFGPSIGRRGVMAPGVNIRSLSSRGQYTNRSGTSFAAPFVTGSIALLWSIFPKASCTQLIHAIRLTNPRKSIIPPLLNVEVAQNLLRNIIKAETPCYNKDRTSL